MMSEEPCPNCKRVGSLSRVYTYQDKAVIWWSDPRFPGARPEHKPVLITKEERSCLDCGFIESKVAGIGRNQERMLSEE
jgi:hypothetical protein